LKDVTDLATLITQKKIKAIFVETSVSEKNIQAVVEGCQQRGHQVRIGGSLYSDAMGKDGTFEGTYIGMVTANVNTIVSALK
jgi:manganese/zinc/iron transport system substrate-binding protein